MTLFAVIFFAGRVRLSLVRTPPSASFPERVQASEILRDEWGVPHVFGKTDADAAFALAYAHAEDDYPTIERALLAARGQASLRELSIRALINDYYAGLFRVRKISEQGYDRLSPGTRAVLEGYADGINYYAALHPDEVEGRVFPVRGSDIVAGFVHKLPLFQGLLQQLLPLYGQKFDPRELAWSFASTDLEELAAKSAAVTTGSNAQAVAAFRSDDDTTRLNINSHQPWTGDVAWYEAHVVSDEGWNLTGGLFPGAPFPLHGHNENLGWAHTVNRADLVDVYELTKRGNGYEIDGAHKGFQPVKIPMEIELGLFTLRFEISGRHSEHGPVLERNGKLYAVRYAGEGGQVVLAAEQWYRMGKAKNFAEWKKAMRIQGVPMFNTVYADQTNIFYVFNALIPQRKAGFDYKEFVPGDRSDLVWHRYLPFDALPSVSNPPSGFVQNCNSSPFRTTTGPGNPDPGRYAAHMGIHTRMTNRSIRSLDLLSRPGKISRSRFLLMKWDRTYDRQSPIYTEAINQVLLLAPENEEEKRAQEILRNWDGRTDETSRAAMLAILTWMPIWFDKEVGTGRDTPRAQDTFREAIDELKSEHGRIDPALGDAQKLVRGELTLPVGGGPDIMNAVYTLKDGKTRRGWAGDSYVLIVEFSKTGTSSSSVHQFGNSNRPDSRHYADQAGLFTKRMLRPALRRKAEIEERLSSRYRPGQEKSVSEE